MKHIKIKGVLMLLLVASLLFSLSPADAIAGVDDLVIGGTAIMTVGLLGCLGVISLQAAGAGGALAQMADNFSYNMETLGSSLMTSYARSQNMPTVDLLEIAQAGTKYTKDGKIIFDERMSQLMDSFTNWAWENNLKEYAEPLPADGPVTVPQQNPFSIPSFSFAAGNYRYNPYTFVGDYYASWFANQGSQGYYVIASGTPNGSGYATYTFNGHTVYYYSLPGGWEFSFTPRNMPFLNPSLSNYSEPSKIAWLMVYGGYVSDGEPVYDVNLDVLKGVSTDQVGVFDPDDLVSIPDAPVSGTINIDDWLRSLAEGIMDAVSSIPITIAQDQVIDAAIELDMTSDIPFDITQESDIENAEDVSDSTSASGLDDYTLDLRDFFPFCIPFDIYRMMQLLSSTRQAPSFTWRFYVPRVVDQNITIDLSAFDSAAAVLRACEKLAFAIGLAFITKKLIQGGD